MKTTRRAFLGSVAVASLPAASAAATALPTTDIPVVSETPDLLAAHERLIAARHELAAAKSALEWIADEWRHLWPLAPEELLGVAGADRHMGTAQGETDIIGNFIRRDCKTLTKRLSPQFRKIDRYDCFSVITASHAQNWLEDFQQRKPRGKTAEALAHSQEVIDRNVREYRERIELAHTYEAETTRLRKAAGVDIAKERITTAENSFYDACGEISKIPAFGPEGLQIKLEALNATGLLVKFERAEGIIGEMARFITTAMEIKGRASI